MGAHLKHARNVTCACKLETRHTRCIKSIITDFHQHLRTQLAIVMSQQQQQQPPTQRFSANNSQDNLWQEFEIPILKLVSIMFWIRSPSLLMLMIIKNETIHRIFVYLFVQVLCVKHLYEHQPVHYQTLCTLGLFSQLQCDHLICGEVEFIMFKASSIIVFVI